MTALSQKKLAAKKALEYVKDGQTIGLGSGSTSTEFIKLLGDAIQLGRFKEIRCVASSNKSEELAKQLNIAVVDMNDVAKIDITVDGADEFDPYLNLIKGGGGALVREKILASISDQFIVITDSSKKVDTLGQFKLPVEVLQFSFFPTKVRLEEKGLSPTLRMDENGNPYISDNGNYILDLDLKRIANPVELAKYLENLPGVVDHGLFIGFANLVIMADDNEILEFEI